MQLDFTVNGLVSTEYALSEEQIEQRIINAITEALSSDCTIDDMHTEVFDRFLTKKNLKLRIEPYTRHEQFFEDGNDENGLAEHTGAEMYVLVDCDGFDYVGESHTFGYWKNSGYPIENLADYEQENAPKLTASMKPQVKKSWEEGANAYHKALGLSENPYEEGTSDYHSWDASWKNSFESDFDKQEDFEDCDSQDLGGTGHGDISYSDADSGL